MRRFLLGALCVPAILLAGSPVAPAAPPAKKGGADLLFAEQWGPQQVRGPEAWATSTGARTIIGVVNSGVDFDPS